MHPLRCTPQIYRLLTETKMTATKFPPERQPGARSLVPLKTSALNVRFATNCHAPTLLLLDTPGRAAACIRQLICCQSAELLQTFPLRLGGEGRLSATAERRDCRLFFTAFHRFFQTVQTGRYMAKTIEDKQQLSQLCAPVCVSGVGGCTAEGTRHQLHE